MALPVNLGVPLGIWSGHAGVLLLLKGIVPHTTTAFAVQRT